jgi:uncharacterized protein
MWEKYATFAAANPYRPLLLRLADLARHPGELPPDEAVADRLVYLAAPSRLDRAFRATKQRARLTAAGVDLPSPAEEIRRFASGLEVEEQRALDVLLRRALDPWEALATWPLETLFSPDEARRIRASRYPSGAEQPDAQAPPARLANQHYRGWVCAIVKVTRLCSLRCTYCNDWRAGPGQTMTFDVQLQLVRHLLDPRDHDAVDLVWHGGEPTLLGRAGFLRLLMLQRWFRREGQQVRNIVQTNAVGVDEEWARFLARYRFHVGVSVDGPAHVHDRMRARSNGKGALHQVLGGIRLLRAAGADVSVLVVIGEAQLAIGAPGLVEFLQSERLTRVGLLPVHPAAGAVREGQAYLTPRRYARFLLEVDQARTASPEPWIAVREIDAALRALHGKQAGLCKLNGGCVGAFYSIEPDGTVMHCDKFAGDPTYVVGNVMTDTFGGIRRSERHDMLIAEASAAVTHREECPHIRFCRGWCPHEDYLARRYDPDYDSGCCGLSDLFAGLASRLAST